MNEDLKFLAESVHEWDERFDMLCRSDLSFSCGPEWFNSKYFDGKHGYTRAQWQAARDELSGKPPVSEWPEWVQWIAQWHDGQWLGYEVEPECGNEDDPSDCYVDPRENPRIHYFGYGDTLTDWRKTLERRPERKKSYTVDEVIDELDIRQEVNEAAVSMGLREWRGPEDGLPPVGCEFEFSANGRSWEGRVMLFNDGVTCLMECKKYPGNRWHYKCKDPDIAFRPIRTEEDKAVEEMLCIMEGGSGELAAKALYRAGYRKQAQQE